MQFYLDTRFSLTKHPHIRVAHIVPAACAGLLHISHNITIFNQFHLNFAAILPRICQQCCLDACFWPWLMLWHRRCRYHRAAQQTDFIFYLQIPKTSPGLVPSAYLWVLNDCVDVTVTILRLFSLLLSCPIHRNFEGRSFRYWFKKEDGTPCNSTVAQVQTGITYEDCLGQCYSTNCELVIFELTDSKLGICQMCPEFQAGSNELSFRRTNKGSKAFPIINAPLTHTCLHTLYAPHT